MPLTVTGCAVPGLAVVPLPSCPSRFSPQQRIVPVESSAQVCPEPAARPTAPVSPFTATGVSAKVPKLPSPRCPDSPKPQHFAVPFDSSAHANSSPAVTRVAVEMPLTGTSTDQSLQLPSPSCPNWFLP